jgi:hypothetical protein
MRTTSWSSSTNTLIGLLAGSPDAVLLTVPDPWPSRGIPKQQVTALQRPSDFPY